MIRMTGPPDAVSGHFPSAAYANAQPTTICVSLNRAEYIEVVIDQRPGEQPQAVPPRRQPHRRGDRDLLTLAATLGQLGRLPPQRPGATDQRGHQQPALVDHGEAGPLASGLFWMRGHWDLSHAATSSGSPSRATRWGFCGVKPRLRIQVQR